MLPHVTLAITKGKDEKDSIDEKAETKDFSVVIEPGEELDCFGDLHRCHGWLSNA